MKVKLLFLFLTCFSLSLARQNQFTFGLKGGFNLSTITGEGTDELETREHIQAGILGELQLSDKFSLQTEVLYSAQGSQYTVGVANNAIRLDYVSAPILAKYYFSEGLSLELGPVFGFLVNAKSVEFFWNI